MKAGKVCVILTILLRILPAAEPKVTDYQTFFGWAALPGTKENVIILRRFRENGCTCYLVVHPQTMATEIVPGNSLQPNPAAISRLRQEFAATPYFKAMSDAERNASALQDAGITHSLPLVRGISLTIDLCPSRKPLDRSLFIEIIAAFSEVEKPVPLAVSVSGLWMENHADDLRWLVDLVKKNSIRVDWINHAYHHPYDPKLKLRQNFLLEKGTNLKAEILLTEQKMIAWGLTPSIFFRFPGLVSNARMITRVMILGLIPVGSDAWLAKNQPAKEGSIVLIHGNGNEPLGIKRFLKLIQKEKAAIKKKSWLLFDLRQSLAPESGDGA